MAQASLASRAWFSLVALVAVLGLILFISAGTLDYWQAWAFLAAFTAPSVAITAHLLKADPALAERRMRGGPTAEGRAIQKLIQVFNLVFFLSLVLLPGLDHRWGWSPLPVWVELVGNALVLAGYAGLFWVMKTNSYAAGSVGIAEGQTVATTGPYALVRHPMYSAGLLLIAGVPLALGSAWGLAPAVGLLAGIIWRLLDEERFLVANLPGYLAYKAKTRFRLAPGIF